MRTIEVILVFVAILLFCSCSRDKNYSLLTDNGKGKYWDLIYLSDTGGRSQEVLVSNESTKVFFFTSDKLIRYKKIDSISIMDLNLISDDKVYSTNYDMNNDTLYFDGKKFNILVLTNDTLKIKSLIYRKQSYYFAVSKYQSKKFL